MVQAHYGERIWDAPRVGAHPDGTGGPFWVPGLVNNVEAGPNLVMG
jgi:hypothetical protein